LLDCFSVFSLFRSLHIYMALSTTILDGISKPVPRYFN
jgi:hypothetical protein